MNSKDGSIYIKLNIYGSKWTKRIDYTNDIQFNKQKSIKKDITVKQFHRSSHEKYYGDAPWGPGASQPKVRRTSLPPA